MGTRQLAQKHSICMLVYTQLKQNADFFSRNPAVLDRYQSTGSLLFTYTDFWAHPRIWITDERNSPGAAPVFGGGRTVRDSIRER